MMTRWSPKYTLFARLCLTNVAVTLTNTEGVLAAARQRPATESLRHHSRNAQNQALQQTGAAGRSFGFQSSLSGPAAELYRYPATRRRPLKSSFTRTRSRSHPSSGRLSSRWSIRTHARRSPTAVSTLGRRPFGTRTKPTSPRSRTRGTGSQTCTGSAAVKTCPCTCWTLPGAGASVGETPKVRAVEHLCW